MYGAVLNSLGSMSKRCNGDGTGVTSTNKTPIWQQSAFPSISRDPQHCLWCSCLSDASQVHILLNQKSSIHLSCRISSVECQIFFLCTLMTLFINQQKPGNANQPFKKKCRIRIFICHNSIISSMQTNHLQIWMTQLPLVLSWMIPYLRHTHLSGWWLNQPNWKICSSNWIMNPQGSGWKWQIFELPPPTLCHRILSPT